ncbi:MAG: glycosyltransferase family 4 protein [Candidatus Margulisbacteria bacterium]|nr:glycosyltransferase family 4 protein [Candidatus Margulisiibacteriota bacterium]
MKVVLLAFWFIEYSIELANALSKTQQVKLIIPEKFFLIFKGLINKDVEVYSFHLARIRYPSSLFMINKIIREINNFNPEVLHYQEGHFLFSLCIPFIKMNYSLVTTIHDVVCHSGDTEVQKSPLWRLRCILVKHSRKFIVHGEFLKRLLVEKYTIPEDKIYVIPHGEFSIYKRFIREEVVEEKDLILFFGRIWEYKGLRYLIEAEPLIAQQIPTIRIVIAGKGEDFDKYEKMMVHKERFIIYNSYISHEKIAELFQRAAVVVLPYVDASQSGIIPIAYSFKKPVIATSVGSIPEVVINGKTGYIVPPKNPRILADAIVKILQNGDLRKEMGHNGFRMSQGELSWDNIAVKTIEVYKNNV